MSRSASSVKSVPFGSYRVSELEAKVRAMENLGWDLMVLALATGFFALSAGMVKAIEWLQKE